jgi:hypothetical protein
MTLKPNEMIKIPIHLFCNFAGFTIINRRARDIVKTDLGSSASDYEWGIC